MENRQIINFEGRMAARREQDRQKQADQFFVNRRIPDVIFAKMGSTDVEDPKVNNYCPTCGYHAPAKVAQGYIRRECACEREARYKMQDVMDIQRTKAQEEAIRIAREAEEASSDACYTWLGEDYSEYGLSELTFENYVTRIMMVDGTRRVIVDAANEERRQYAKARAIAYAQNPIGNIIFHGLYGLGKTHLACAILNYLRAQGKSGLFTTGANLFNALMAQDEQAARQRIIARMYRTPLLVIDDPDHATATEFRVNTYKEIFNKRGNNNLPTIITTNIPIKRDAMELQEVIGGAAASRLNKGLILVGLRGEDYRKLQIG